MFGSKPRGKMLKVNVYVININSINLHNSMSLSWLLHNNLQPTQINFSVLFAELEEMI